VAVDQFQKALDRLNEIYAEYKCGPDVYYMAPEIRPQVQSQQVLALLSLLVEQGFYLYESFAPSTTNKV
jgi:hypothetical protein